MWRRKMIKISLCEAIKCASFSILTMNIVDWRVERCLGRRDIAWDGVCDGVRDITWVGARDITRLGNALEILLWLVLSQPLKAVSRTMFETMLRTVLLNTATKLISSNKLTSLRYFVEEIEGKTVNKLQKKQTNCKLLSQNHYFPRVK